MEKIPTMCERDWDGDRSRVLDKIVPGCEWVAAGEGVATQKLDGTACLINESGWLYKRHALRAPVDKFSASGLEVDPNWRWPDGFQIVDIQPDAKKPNEFVKVIGWLPVGDGPEDKWHRQAFDRARENDIPRAGTYELLGPKVQGDPEHMGRHELVAHADAPVLDDAPRDFDGLRDYFGSKDIEGIVWHHPDGRMAKIKGRDFGLKRQPAVPA